MIKRSSVRAIALMLALIAVSGVTTLTAVDLEYFNVKTYGAAGNGIADDTAAINSALAAARTAGRGTVFFPAGIYNTTGSHDLSGTSGIRILGSGIGATVLKVTHATHDLFFSNTTTTDLTLQDFSVNSDAGVRTGGWVYHAGAAYNAGGYLLRSRIESIEVTYQVNGFWIAQYNFVWMKDLMMSTFVGSGGIGIKAGQTTASPNYNQGSELYILGTQIYGNDLVTGSSTPPYLSIGIWIEDCDAVYAVNSGVGGTVTNNLRIVGNGGGYGSHNHFFDQFISDATRDSHGVWITGTGVVSDVKFTGSWFASAGQIMGGSASANGIHIDVASLGFMEITGSRVFNNRGTGIYVAAGGTSAPLTISGNSLSSNGLGNQPNNTDGIFVDVPVNNLGPVISGNQDAGETGVALRTSATANRIVAVGNRFTTGASFGITPLVQALNDGVGSAFVAGSGAPSPFTAARGYSFAAPGDQDGGLFSVADGTVSIYTNSVEALQVQPNQNAVFRQSLTVAGNLSVGGIKAFVQPHPYDPGKEIRYNSVEAPTADVYFRGVGRLHRGRNRIEVPEHFRLVASGPYQVLATPVRRAARLTVVAADAAGIVLEASRDVDASYVVYAGRAAFKDSAPITDNVHFIPPGERGFDGALPEAYRRLLIANGTLNADGTTNLETARRLGWSMAGTPAPAAPAASVGAGASAAAATAGAASGDGRPH